MPNDSSGQLNSILGNAQSAAKVAGENNSLETQQKQIELTKEHTAAINEKTAAIREQIKVEERLNKTALDSARQITSAHEKIAREIKANNDKIIESNRALGDSALDMAKKETRALNEMNKARDDFWGKVRQGVQLVKGFADNVNKTLVELNKVVLDTTNSMGVMASSTGDILSGQVKLNGQLKNVNLSYKEMNDAIGKISLSGRITSDEAKRLFTSLTAVGVSARDVSDIFTKTDGVLGLINSGFLKTEEASSLVQDAITGMGKSAEVAERQMMGIVAITGKLNDSFGKGTFSTHQMIKEILSLQQSLRFIETDLERLPVYLASFAGAAKKYKDVTGKGISQEAAIELGKQQMGATTSMDIARASFLGQKAGLGPGLLGGEKFFALDPQKRVSMMKDVLLRESGMNAISDEEMERAEKIDPVRAAKLAEKRQLQVGLLKEFTGVDDQRGRKLLNLYSQNADKKTIEEELKTDEQRYKDDVRKYLEASAKDNATQTQTIKEWYEKWKDYILGKAQAATGGWANLGAAVVSAAASLGTLALQFRGLKFGTQAASWTGRAASWIGRAAAGGTASRAASLMNTFATTFPKTTSALSSTANVLAKVVPGLSRVAPVATKAAPFLKFAPGVGLAIAGASELYAASSGNQAAGLFGKKNRSAWSMGGMADDAMIMGAGTLYGGPIGTAATGLALAGIRAYGAHVARGQAKESLREGVDFAGAVYGKSGSQKFKDFARSHSDTYKDIAESNLGGWWGRNKSFGETYGGASSEQKTAMDDAFKAYIEAAQVGDKNEAKRYMGQIRSFISPETKTIDALNVWLKQNRKDLGTVSESASGDFNDITRVIGARENTWDAGLDEKKKEEINRIRKAAEEGKLEEEIERQKKEAEALAEKKKQQEEINLTAVTNLDGVVIARTVAKHLMSGGIFAPGNNANLAGIG